MGILDMFGAGPIATLADDILKMFPNAEQRAAAATKLEDMAAAIASAQSATNTAEAGTGNLFIAGWRPFIGWVCGLGFTYSIFQPLLHLPPIDQTVLDNTLWGLLGLGTMRSAEKIGGVATSVIKGVFKK